MAFVDTDGGSEIKIPDSSAKIYKAHAAGACNGNWIDRSNFMSMKAFGVLGSAAGSPSAQGLTLKIQDATDNSGTGAADYKPDGSTTAQSTTGTTTDNSVTTLNVNLKNARQYIRVVGTLAFTSGTSPTQDVVLGAVLCGGSTPPYADTNG